MHKNRESVGDLFREFVFIRMCVGAVCIAIPLEDMKMTETKAWARDAVIIHLITNQRLQPESTLSGRFDIILTTVGRGDTTAHHEVAKSKNNKDSQGQRRCANDRSILPSISERDEKSWIYRKTTVKSLWAFSFPIFLRHAELRQMLEDCFENIFFSFKWST